MTFDIRSFKSLISPSGIFSDGDWVESKDQDPNGNVRLIQLADIGVNKFLNKSKRYITKEKAKELRCTFLEQGDILIARMPYPIGRACIFTTLDMPCVTVVDVCIVRPVTDEVDEKWLMYFINSQEFNHQILQFVTGTTRQRISKSNLAKLKTPLPPIETQKQIAQVLEAADQLRKDCQQVEQELNALAQSVFLDMFGDPATNPKGWKKSNLGAFIKIKHGYAFKGEYFATEGDYVLLTPGNFLENGGYRNQGIKQKFYLGDFPDEYMLDKGDLLVAMTEQAAGLLGSPLFSPSDGAFLHNQRLGLVQTVKRINKQFLFGLFNTSSIRQQIHFKAVGTKVRHTSPTKIEELNVGIPPIKLQNKFSSFIEKLEQQKQHNQEKSQQLDDLFNALLQKAFKGELNLKSTEHT